MTTKTGLGFVNRQLAGQVVRERVVDKYFDATAMCQAAGKRFANWSQNADTQELLEALATDTGIPVTELIQSVRGGLYQGSWIHPKVAIALAMWCSPTFHVKVVNWVYDGTVGATLGADFKELLRDLIRDEVSKRLDSVDLGNVEIHGDMTDGFSTVNDKLREEDWWEIRRVLARFNVVTDRSYSARISHKLVSFLAGKSSAACRKSPNNGKTWQFDINAAVAWRDAEGKAEIDGRIEAAQHAAQDAKRKASRQMGLFADNVLPISPKPKPGAA